MRKTVISLSLHYSIRQLVPNNYPRFSISSTFPNTNLTTGSFTTTYFFYTSQSKPSRVILPFDHTFKYRPSVSVSIRSCCIIISLTLFYSILFFSIFSHAYLPLFVKFIFPVLLFDSSS